MSTSIDQKAYLQKYLGGSSGDKKKKKKKAVKGKGFKIIDDDIDLSKLRPLDGDELDIFDEGEDAPQIAGIVDDRPEELKQLEQLKTSSKWKVVNQDDGFNSKLQIEEIKKDIKETEKENELIFGKMYSDSEDEKNDSDLSPPRKGNNSQKDTKSSKKHNSDSDFSPPRKGNGSQKDTKLSKNHGSDSDFSPPRRNDGKSHKSNNSRASPSRNKERVRKPSRWGDKEDVIEIIANSPRMSKRDSHKRRSPSSDASPPRRSKHNSDASPSRKYKKNYDSDQSPPRKSKKNYDSDQSPPRKSRKASGSPKMVKRGHDSDVSPPRKSKMDTKGPHKSPDAHSPSKRRKHSPQRHSTYKDERQDKSRKHRHSSESDLSPPRKNRRKSPSPARKSRKSPDRKRKYGSDSDQSPPRRNKDKDRDRKRNDSPPPSNKKMTKTLDGKMAGLQDARQLRQENDEFRKREEEAFRKMTDEVSGRNAKAVSRKGKRETSEDRQKQREKAERQKILDEKYKKWSRGLKQIEDQEARVQEFMHEASKPLARHKGDRDLEDNLKQIERAGDPMLQYIKEKKRERGELGPERPSYKGSFPPNRFNIRPGYRWDGVDRSNGYEKKFFEQQSKRKAQEEEAYKWSTEDL